MGGRAVFLERVPDEPRVQGVPKRVGILLEGPKPSPHHLVTHPDAFPDHRGASIAPASKVSVADRVGGSSPLNAGSPGATVRKELRRRQTPQTLGHGGRLRPARRSSQRADFEATHPAALAGARRFAAEPVLRVADLGAADGVNSHGLIRDLMEERAGRALVYALVDLPTNEWRVAAEHLRHAFSGAEDRVVVVPARGEAGPGVADAGTGPHYASPEAHGDGCRRAVEHGPPPATVVSLAGIPIEQAPCLPEESVHVAVTGTAMHWIADASWPGLDRLGLPWATRCRPTRHGAASLGARLQRGSGNVCSSLRAIELAPGGRFIAALPASPAPCPDRTGVYVELIGDMNRLLADWHRAGRICAATVAAVVVPVWQRTLEEIREPFDARGGSIAGLELEHVELFRLDNPYWDDDPAVFSGTPRRPQRHRVGPTAPPPRVRP